MATYFTAEMGGLLVVDHQPVVNVMGTACELHDRAWHWARALSRMKLHDADDIVQAYGVATARANMAHLGCEYGVAAATARPAGPGAARSDPPGGASSRQRS